MAAGVSLWFYLFESKRLFTEPKREREGIDLNRQYLNPEAHEVRAHIEWLKRQPSFDLSCASMKTGNRTAFMYMN